MSEKSQILVEPYWVRFHAVTEDGTNKAYAFLVTHEEIDPNSDPPKDQRWGAVWVDDEDQEAGLSGGWNSLHDIGHGGPGSNVSWSEF